MKNKEIEELIEGAKVKVSGLVKDISDDIKGSYWEAALHKLDKFVKEAGDDFVTIACCAIIEAKIRRMRDDENLVKNLGSYLEIISAAEKEVRVNQTSKRNDIYIDRAGSEELELPYFNKEEENIQIRNANHVWQTKCTSWGHNWDSHHVDVLKPHADKYASIKLESMKRPGWWRILK